MSARLRFQVVPLAEAPKDDVTIISPEDQQPVVLIVDDERVIAETLSIILSKNGYSTMTAYNGLSALKQARVKPPDLLISDVVMPGMTGVDLAITFTHEIPACKILLFSGQAETVDLLEKARLKGHSFVALTKPVHPADMLRRISECLALWEAGQGRHLTGADDSGRAAVPLFN